MNDLDQIMASRGADNNETYNGWKNRETWAFWLYVSNDEGLYEMVREAGLNYVDDHVEKYGEGDVISDHDLGEHIIPIVQGALETVIGHDLNAVNDPTESQGFRIYSEIGSWWRVDDAEIGAAVREDLKDY